MDATAARDLVVWVPRRHQVSPPKFDSFEKFLCRTAQNHMFNKRASLRFHIYEVVFFLFVCNFWAVGAAFLSWAHWFPAYEHSLAKREFFRENLENTVEFRLQELSPKAENIWSNFIASDIFCPFFTRRHNLLNEMSVACFGEKKNTQKDSTAAPFSSINLHPYSGGSV